MHDVGAKGPVRAFGSRLGSGGVADDLDCKVDLRQYLFEPRASILTGRGYRTYSTDSQWQDIPASRANELPEVQKSRP